MVPAGRRHRASLSRSKPPPVPYTGETSVTPALCQPNKRLWYGHLSERNRPQRRWCHTATSWCGWPLRRPPRRRPVGRARPGRPAGGGGGPPSVGSGRRGGADAPVGGRGRVTTPRRKRWRGGRPPARRRPHRRRRRGSPRGRPPWRRRRRRRGWSAAVPPRRCCFATRARACASGGAAPRAFCVGGGGLAALVAPSAPHLGWPTPLGDGRGVERGWRRPR